MTPAETAALSIILQTAINEFGARLGDPSTRLRLFHDGLKQAYAVEDQTHANEIVAAMRTLMGVPLPLTA